MTRILEEDGSLTDTTATSRVSCPRPTGMSVRDYVRALFPYPSTNERDWNVQLVFQSIESREEFAARNPFIEGDLTFIINEGCGFRCFGDGKWEKFQ